MSIPTNVITHLPYPARTCPRGIPVNEYFVNEDLQSINIITMTFLWASILHAICTISGTQQFQLFSYYVVVQYSYLDSLILISDTQHAQEFTNDQSSV